MWSVGLDGRFVTVTMEEVNVVSPMDMMLDLVVISDIERMWFLFSMMGVTDGVNGRRRRSIQSPTAKATQTTRNPPITPPTIAPIFFEFLGVLTFVISGRPNSPINK